MLSLFDDIPDFMLVHRQKGNRKTRTRQEQETDLQGFGNLAGLTKSIGKSIGKDWVYCIPLDTNPQGLKDLIGFKKYS